MAERTPCKVEDFLDNDQPVRGQNYVCLSFISPEDVIVKKDVYFFNKFMNLFSTDITDLFTKLTEKFKDDVGVVDMFTNLRDRYDYIFDVQKLQEEFTFYKALNNEMLESEYLAKNNFQTSIRGIKIRGSYETLPEAQRRAEQLKKLDGKFDVYVAEVGCWCPWAPNPVAVQDQEYGETELNTLMKKYKENLDEKEIFYRSRAEEMRKKAKDQPKQQLELVEELPDDAVPLDEQDDPWMQHKTQQPVADDIPEEEESSSELVENPDTVDITAP